MPYNDGTAPDNQDGFDGGISWHGASFFNLVGKFGQRYYSAIFVKIRDGIDSFKSCSRRKSDERIVIKCTFGLLMKRVLIADYVDHSLVVGLIEAGFTPVYAPEVPNEKVADWLENCAGIIVNTRTPVRRELMEAAPNLKFIGRLGAGLDIIDLEEADRRGISVIPTPGANANAVGEHMFGMLLALMHNILWADRSVRQGAWVRERHRGEELTGKTIGIIGFGNTGSAFASKFAGWKTNVLAYDKYKEHYAADYRFVEETDLETVLEHSDVISLHVPLTEETKYLVNDEFLLKCKDGVIILNGSRGKVVDTGALLRAMDRGKVKGACLDVVENENPENRLGEEALMYENLFSRKQTILTPHIAGWTKESKRNIAYQLLKGIRARCSDF